MEDGNNDIPSEEDIVVEITEADYLPVIRERSGTRTGLRRLTKPLGNHRNLYEREFSRANIKLRSDK